MESLKRLYFSLAAGLAVWTGNKVESASGSEDGQLSNRVSREVDHYRTHFFNL